MNKFTLWIAAFTVVFLSGCAATKVPPEIERQIKTVGIVSLLPEKANFAKIGLTVFNNEYSDIDMGGQLNEMVTSVIAKRLAVSRPAWTVRNISYDRAALLKGFNTGGMVMAYYEERIEKELAQLSKLNGLDAIVVVSSFKPENVHGDGVGVLLRTTSLSSIDLAYVHSYISLKIIDATGKIAAVSRTSTTEKPINPVAYGLQYRMNENTSPALMTSLRAAVEENLDLTVVKKLFALDM